MPSPQPSPFACPHCGAKYQLVRIEAAPAAVPDRELICRGCGGPLHAREGAFFLKYFLVEGRGQRKRGASAAPVVAQPLH